MGKLFYMMGKSSVGKDTIYEELLQREHLHLNPIVMYTTRPIREKEMNGKEYFFVDEARLSELERQGRVVELRSYDTMHGVWKYFTVDDEQIDFEKKDYLAIGTLESYEKIREYYGRQQVVPIYIEVDDGIRLGRALKRELKPQNRRFEELCRRFLADAADYSEENLVKAGITRRFSNNEDRQLCMDEIEEFIEDCQKAEQREKLAEAGTRGEEHA